MFRQIVLAIAAVVIAVVVAAPASANTYDYKNGYFDNKPYTTTCSPYLFDNKALANLNLAQGSVFATNGNCTISFDDPINIYHAYANVTGSKSTFILKIQFLSGSTVLRTLMYTSYPTATSGVVEDNVSLNLKNVTSIKIDKATDVPTTSVGYPRYLELEIFDQYYGSPVNNLSVAQNTTTLSTVRASYVAHTSATAFVRYDYLLDGVLVDSTTTRTQSFYNFTNVPEGNHTFTVRSVYDGEYYADATKELEIVLPPQDDVTNIVAAPTDTSVLLTYKLPAKYSHVQIYRNDQLIADNHKTASFVDNKDLVSGTTYTYKVVAVATYGKKSTGVTVDATYVDKPPNDVTELAAAVKDKKDITLSYKLPSNTDFSHVQIYRDDKLIADKYTDTTYTDKSLMRGETYTYKIVAVDIGGNKSSGVTKTVAIPTDSVELSNLSVTATSSSATLKWTNNKHASFEHVTIYRKADNFLANVRAVFAAGDGYTKLDTTKDNSFTDSTVEPDTKYSYKVTTTIDGTESAGITIDVKTKPVQIDDTTIDKQANGDYIVTWGSPTTGKMQINVGGQKYAIVPAANKKFTIPAADVKLTALGLPDVQLIPLNDDEQPIGPGTQPGGGGLGSLGGGDIKGIFSAPDLLNAAVSLLALIGLFVVFGLSFRLVPKLIAAIKNAFYSGGSVNK